jgi:hypothetical protein
MNFWTCHSYISVAWWVIEMKFFVVVRDTLRNVRKKNIWDRFIGTGFIGKKVKKMQLYNKVTIHSYIEITTSVERLCYIKQFLWKTVACLWRDWSTSNWSHFSSFTNSSYFISSNTVRRKLIDSKFVPFYIASLFAYQLDESMLTIM